MAPGGFTAELAQTVLWRQDVVRVCCREPRHGLDLAFSLSPDLVILGALPVGTTLTMLRRIGMRETTRRTAVVVIARALSASSRSAFEAAGAAAVWTAPVDPRHWDGLLGGWLGVPTRRALRTPVRLKVWSRRPDSTDSMAGLALDLSVTGMLLETLRALDVGTRVDLAFALPGAPDEVQAVAQVVRECEGAGLPRFGIEFLALSADSRDRIAAFVESERRTARG